MIFFFYGTNSYSLRRQLRQLEGAYVSKTGSNYGLEHIDGASASVGEVANALRVMPFLAKSRLVIIEGLGRNKAAQTAINQLLSDIPDSTVAVFYDLEVDRRTNYFKTLIKLAKVQNFELLSTAQLQLWVKREVERLGGVIDKPALVALLERVGDDQWRLEQEINKLVNYSPNITKSCVEELVQASFVETIFSLVEAMTIGQTDKANRVYQGLIAEKTNEIYILTMITWQIRNLLMARSAGSISTQELVGLTGMSPYVAGKMQTSSQKFTEKRLRQMMILAIETEYRIKSGAVPLNLAIEQLIFNVANQSEIPSP